MKNKPTRFEVLSAYLLIGALLSLIGCIANIIDFKDLFGGAIMIGLFLWVMFAPRR